MTDRSSGQIPICFHTSGRSLHLGEGIHLPLKMHIDNVKLNHKCKDVFFVCLFVLACSVIPFLPLFISRFTVYVRNGPSTMILHDE